MKNFFESVHTLDELKAEFRRLVLKHHPDRGGDLETMKQINLAYEARHEELKHAWNSSHDEAHQCTEAPEEFRAIIEALLKMPGIEVELCGSWLWLSGSTYEHKDELKALGCKWASSKKMWSWHHAEAGSRFYRGKRTMGEIRTKYGSQTFEAGRESTGYERLGATAESRRPGKEKPQMIYAEWLSGSEFNNAFFHSWSEYHAATFSPEIEILFVKEIAN